jgi:hypothetical protein
MQLNPANCLATAGTRDSCRMRITQSISLSNINAFSRRPRPEAVETCRMLPACFLIGVNCFCNQNKLAAIRKQRMSLVELSGIEPLTSCLQSTRSPN